MKKADYADHYRRMLEMARDKGWTQEQLNVVLADREQGERDYEMVSRI